MADLLYVQSLQPSAAYPVAGTYRNFTGVGTGFVQLVEAYGSFTQGGSWHVTVPSLAVGQVGAPWSVVGCAAASQQGSWHVTVPSLAVGQAGAPWTFVGCVQAAQGGAPWTTVASVLGQVSVTASVPGGVAQSGSWQVTVPSLAVGQAGAPWSVVGCVATTQSGSWTVTVPSLAVGQAGAWSVSQADAPWTTVASVPGQVTATVSVAGAASVVASVIGQVTASIAGVPTVTGSVGATQLGAPWTFVGCVQATQGGSWQVTVPSLAVGQAGAPWTTVTSLVGQPTATVSVAGVPTVVGCVQAAQSGSWQVTVPSLAVGQAGAWSVSQAGAPWSVVGCAAASQQGSWTVTVPSLAVGQAGAPWSVVGCAAATQAGSWRTITEANTWHGERIVVPASGVTVPNSILAGRTSITFTSMGSQFIYVGPTGVGCGNAAAVIGARGFLTLPLGTGAVIALATNGSSQGNSPNSGQVVHVAQFAIV